MDEFRGLEEKGCVSWGLDGGGEVLSASRLTWGETSRHCRVRRIIARPRVGGRGGIHPAKLERTPFLL